MKTNIKLFGIMAIVAIVTLALAFITCDNGDDDQPQFRETTITLTFGEGTYSAKVQGTLLEAEWNGVPNKVKDLLEAGYNATPGMGQGGLKTYFVNNNVTVIVEKTTEYTKYKTVATETAVMYFNIDALDDMTGEKVANAFSYMTANNSHSD
jgi:hypothetical protein